MKIKVLEVNNIDLIGRRFNGYDLMHALNRQQDFEVKQAVVHKFSADDSVLPIINPEGLNLLERLAHQEDSILSVHSVLSISSPLLRSRKEYQEADIIHFHMFHNSKLSLLDLKEILQTKRVVISLHDPWWMTGRCVHPYDCAKWKEGCTQCPNLGSLFPMRKDYAHLLWDLKKDVFAQASCDLIVSSTFMENMVKESPILQGQECHHIPLGININEFTPQKENEDLRRKYGIPKDNIVFFFRSQKEFKGTNYIIEALKDIPSHMNFTFLTCAEVGLLDELKEKFQIMDFGVVKSNEQLLDLYHLCDCFLMPSLGESFGYMAVEAMACAKPVIVFDNTALPEVTFAPNCGYLVEDRNVEQLKEAMLYLAAHPEERQRRGALGRERVEEHYNIDDYHNKIGNLYRHIMQKEINPQQVKAQPRENNNSQETLNDSFTIIHRNLDIPYDFSFLKKRKKHLFRQKEKVDYTKIENQELISTFNKELSKCLDVGNRRHPFKTACRLLFYDRKKLVKQVKEKLWKKAK